MKINVFRFVFLTILFASFGQLHATNQIITLQSVDNNKYVRAGVGSGTLLAAVSPHRRGWEKFEKIELGGDIIALKSVQNGKIVRAGVGKKTLLAAVSSHTKGWEKFQKISFGNNIIALKSVQNEKYVRVNSANSSLLSAVSSHIGSKEKFRLKIFTPAVPRVNVTLRVTRANVDNNWNFSFNNRTTDVITYWIYTNEGDETLNHRKECVVSGIKTCQARARVGSSGTRYWVTKRNSRDVEFEGVLP